jgi:phage pi2 protein 07
MNDADGQKEIILVTKKIFMERKESKDMGTWNMSVMERRKPSREEKKVINSQFMTRRNLYEKRRRL